MVYVSVYILLLIILIELMIIRFLFEETLYWKQVAKTQKEMMKKWWYEEK